MVQAILDVVSEYGGWIAGFSVLSVVVAAVVVPALIVRMPADYFSHPVRPQRWRNRPVAVRAAVNGVRNLGGALVVVLGFVLLFLPGQGLLTVIVGLMVMDFPGKFRFESWLARRRLVLPTMNWLRVKYHRAPLEAPPPPG